MAEKCLVCNEEVDSDDSGLCNVGEKGIIGLVRASVLRKDGKDKDLKTKTNGVVHGACRKDYTRGSSIKKYVSENISAVASTSSTLRSSQPTFDFRSQCFLCTENIDEQKERKKAISKRRGIYHVRTPSVRTSIIARGEKRGDEWGADVARRVCSVADLHEADALYHADCYKRFMLKSAPSNRGRGRPADEGISEAMEEVYAYIEENDSCQFSINELLQQVTGEPLEMKTVIKRLKEKYGDRIVITLQGKKTVICLRSSGCKILNDEWYTARCKDEKSERDRIVRTAAEIILQDIETTAYDSQYPPAENFCSGAEDMVPQSLRSFLDYISESKRSRESPGTKLTVIAHALIAVVRPRSFVSPILNSIAHFISRKLGSVNMVSLLSKLGLSAMAVYHAPMEDITVSDEEEEEED